MLQQNTKSLYQENAFVNVVCKMLAILPRLQCFHNDKLMTDQIKSAFILHIVWTMSLLVKPYGLM